jgi:hypothetical protein
MTNAHVLQDRADPVGALPDQGPLVIVSGQPRGGTSLMMRILDVSGFPFHAAEYASYEDVATTQMTEQTNDWVLMLKPWTAIKVFYIDLPNLPVARHYKILWMQRYAKNQAASQRRYTKQDRAWELARRKFIIKVNHTYMPFFRDKCPNVELEVVRFEHLVTHPKTVKYQIEEFLGREIDVSPVVIRNPKVSETPLGTLELLPFKKEIKAEYVQELGRPLTAEENSKIDKELMQRTRQ